MNRALAGDSVLKIKKYNEFMCVEREYSKYHLSMSLKHRKHPNYGIAQKGFVWWLPL
jgi:hypothetical protein